MSQELNILCCYSCKTYQAQIVKKAKKWQCKMCNEKQSIQRVYFQGSGKDCRMNVQKLNLMKSSSTFSNNTDHPSTYPSCSFESGADLWSRNQTSQDKSDEANDFPNVVSYCKESFDDSQTYNTQETCTNEDTISQEYNVPKNMVSWQSSKKLVEKYNTQETCINEDTSSQEYNVPKNIVSWRSSKKLVEKSFPYSKLNLNCDEKTNIFETNEDFDISLED